MAVAHDFTFHDVNHFFSDVLGVIRDSLDMPRGREAVQGGLDIVGM